MKLSSSSFSVLLVCSSCAWNAHSFSVDRRPSPALVQHVPLTAHHSTLSSLDENDPTAAVSRKEALVKGAGVLSSLFLGKEFVSAHPASASTGVLASPPAAADAASMATTAATAAVNAKTKSQQSLAAITAGTGAVALVRDAMTHNKNPISVVKAVANSQSTASAASVIVQQQEKKALGQRIKVAARTLQRVLRITVLAVPLAVSYPFAKKDPKSYNKWLNFFLKQSERGGAVVIKLCQWASSRPDIFGTEFCEVTKKLQDGTTPHAWSHTERTLKENYGEDWRDHFDVDQNVLGSGCIAQVYKGTVDAVDDGENNGKKDVAIKVVHPNVRKGIEHDLNILRFLAHTLERLPFGYGELLQWNNLSGMVEEFSNMLVPQLDLRNEARNLQKFKENFKDYPHVVFPELVEQYESHPEVLVETFCEGVPLEQFCKEHEAQGDTKLRATICDRAAHIMCTMIFEHNFVHGDLHPGNIFINKDNKMVLLDCGIVNEYGDADHDLLVNIIAAFIRMDGGKAAELMADDSNRRMDQVGQSSKNVDEYIASIEELSKAPRKTDFLFEKIGTYCNYIFNAAATHHVKMNPVFISMALAVKVQEGVALMLNPSCELIKIANPIILKAQAKRMNRGMGDRLRQYTEDAIRDFQVKFDRNMNKLEGAEASN